MAILLQQPDAARGLPRPRIRVSHEVKPRGSNTLIKEYTLNYKGPGTLIRFKV